MLNHRNIKKGFILAGIMNISGPLVFSRFLTNEVIPNVDAIMSNFGLVQITIWGLIYIAMSQKYDQLKWLIAVFVIEKLIYSIHWTSWIINNSLTSVYDADFMAGMFYAIYGINDWFFAIFFFVVFIKLIKEEK